jgi:hypothetical protein
MAMQSVIQCPSPLMLWLWIPLIAKCTRYNIKFVSDLQQVCGFLRVLLFPPPIKLIYCWTWRNFINLIRIWNKFIHTWIYIFLICERSELFMVKNVYLGFSSHGFTYWWIYFFSAHCKHVPCNTLTHSTNEDLLNIKRKGDAKSRTISRMSNITETRNQSFC